MVVSRICHYELFNSLNHRPDFRALLKFLQKKVEEHEEFMILVCQSSIKWNRKKWKTLQVYNQVFHEPK